MTTTTSANVREFIDEQKVSRYQILVVSLCAIIVMADGFDAQVLGYIAPSLNADWNLQHGALGPAFGIGLFGMLLGSLIIGPVADRIGRRKVMISATLFFGLCTLATVTADSLLSLSVWRFLTGLGLGATMPNAIALTSEYSPRRRKATMVMLMFLGFGIGSAICGAVAAKLLTVYGWTSMFLIGGIIPIALVPVLIFALPESPTFMALQGNQDQRIRSILKHINPARNLSEDTQFFVNEEIASGYTVSHLFSNQRALGTLMLWIMYSAGLFNLYFLMAWLPTIITNLGVSIESAALITANMQVAITVSTLLVAIFADRIGVHRILPVLYFMAAVFIASIGLAGTSSISLFGSSATLVAIVVFGAGFFVGGGQNSANALAAIFYPTFIRSTGVSWSHGIGRAASILGPVVGGTFLSMQLALETMFFIIAVPMVCASFAAYVMYRKYDSTLMTEAKND